MKLMMMMILSFRKKRKPEVPWQGPDILYAMYFAEIPEKYVCEIYRVWLNRALPGHFGFFPFCCIGAHHISF
jgi:hypothetical protein